MLDASPRVRALLLAIGIAIAFTLWALQFNGCFFFFTGCWI